MPEEFRELLAREFAPYARLSSLQLDQLERHFELLQRWNARMNLTRIRKNEQVVRLHYCESLFLGTLLPPGRLRIADLGSGAGFPGIPLAILRPECELTLIESHQRKGVFLREATRELRNIRVLSTRAEDVGEAFDWVVSRAVLPSEVTALKLASKLALLIGEEDARWLPGWEAVHMPWGRGRVAALNSVPRETVDVIVPRATC